MHWKWDFCPSVAKYYIKCLPRPLTHPHIAHLTCGIYVRMAHCMWQDAGHTLRLNGWMFVHSFSGQALHPLAGPTLTPPNLGLGLGLGLWPGPFCRAAGAGIKCFHLLSLQNKKVNFSQSDAELKFLAQKLKNFNSHSSPPELSAGFPPPIFFLCVFREIGRDILGDKRKPSRSGRSPNCFGALRGLAAIRSSATGAGCKQIKFN